MSNTQHKISVALFDTFSFIERTSENELMLREVVRMMGWELDELAGFSIDDLSDALRPLANELKGLVVFVDNPPTSFSDFEKVLELSENLFKHIMALNQVLANLEFNGPGKERLGEFAEDVVNCLIVHYLAVKFPLFYHLSVLLTIIKGIDRLAPLSTDEERTIRHSSIIPAFHPKRITKLFNNPVSLLTEEYFPNGLSTEKDAITAANKLFPRLANILNELGINTVFGYNKQHGLEFTEHGDKIIAGMLTAFLDSDIGEQDLDFSLSLALSPTNRGDLGLVVIPSGNFNFSNTIDEWLVQMKLSAGIEGFAIGRDDVTVLAATETTAFNASLILQKIPVTENAPTLLWGSADGSHLQIGGLLVSSVIDYDNQVLAFDFFVQALSSSIKISPKDGDGFINSILPSDGLLLDFDFGIGWSNQRGLHFKGSAGTEAVYPIHKKILNTLVFDRLYLRFQAKDTMLQLEALLDFSVEIGPVEARINTVGIKSALDNLGETGNIGFGNLSLGFAYPKGIGILVKSDILTGGGFLELDPGSHRYSGVLALKLALEKRDIGLVAVGLIETRLPNAEKGFSMLISISVYFSPAIPLAFGFKLNAVGGLVGIHRTMNVDILRERIRNGAVKSVMFPENVIENAPMVLSNLRAVFPAQKNHYVVAPFFKIGYGTPTVLEADLGILLEIPFKGRLILLGSLGVYLPNKDSEKRLGEIHVDIFGDLNFAGSYVLVEGRLRDSELSGVALTGGFAFILDWGSNPQFLLAVGGYHPRYKKPARFPEIPRVNALIKKGEDIRLSCEFYQAITSNSYQIGFSAELVVNRGNARAYGFLGFNALLQFDPFYFETDIRISVEVSYRGRSFFGIDMEFVLSGPEPWRARGYAKIKVLFFSLKIKFNISWGGEQKAVPVFISPEALLDKLKNRLEESGNWSGLLPEGYSGAESLRSPEEAEKQDRIFMHPSGYLELRQNLVPLNKTIGKLGNSYMETVTSYRITHITFGNGEPIDAGTQKPILDYFSRGQFEDLADSEKLSAPDFDLMSAGIQVVPDRVYDISPQVQFTANDFEDILIRGTGSSSQAATFNWQEERVMNLSGGKKPIDVTRPEQLYGVLEKLPDLREKAFKILSREALASPMQLEEQYFSSYSVAKDYLQAHWP
ncbi:MAG TPA: DUF6603 domain-containing protein, partial [Lunatimonas sp.]|nr:DUF6603 domain-containing protein [Lunatimonas sp.]